MRELLVAAIESVAYLVGTTVLAGAGVFAELNSFSYLDAGNTTFAVWLGVMGAVALYAAFSIGTDRLLPRLRERRA
jgi:hypothetical protein